MDKKQIDRMIPVAYQSLSKLSKNGKIDKTYRGGVSRFGAAVSMGSLESAAAFFSADKSGASYDRKELGKIIVKTASLGKTEKTLYDYVMGNTEDKNVLKNRVLDAAVAVKLALNLYELS